MAKRIAREHDLFAEPWQMECGHPYLRCNRCRLCEFCGDCWRCCRCYKSDLDAPWGSFPDEEGLDPEEME